MAGQKSTRQGMGPPPRRATRQGTPIPIMHRSPSAPENQKPSPERKTPDTSTERKAPKTSGERTGRITKATPASGAQRRRLREAVADKLMVQFSGYRFLAARARKPNPWTAHTDLKKVIRRALTDVNKEQAEAASRGKAQEMFDFYDGSGDYYVPQDEEPEIPTETNSKAAEPSSSGVPVSIEEPSTQYSKNTWPTMRDLTYNPRYIHWGWRQIPLHKLSEKQRQLAYDGFHPMEWILQ